MRRIAIIGAGRMGLVHAKAWSSLGDRVAITSVASRKPVDWADQFGARQSADIERVVTSPEVDIVDICLPTPMHPRVAVLALEAGKHVLCEKPMALDMAGVQQITEAARRGPGRLMIAHVVRFFPAYAAIREIVESGRLGAPTNLSAHRLAAGSRSIAWLRDATQSGGVAMDLLVHDYDQANLLLGPPQSVYAQSHGREGVNVIIRHAGGGLSAIEGNTAMPAGFPFSTAIRVHCEGGVVEHHADGGDLRVIVREPGVAPVVQVIDPVDPYAVQACHFIDRLDAGLPMDEGSPEQGIAAVAVATAALASIRSGQPEAIRQPG